MAVLSVFFMVQTKSKVPEFLKVISLYEIPSPYADSESEDNIQVFKEFIKLYITYSTFEIFLMAS